MADYSPRWYTRSKTVTNPSCNRARRALTSFIENSANHYATPSACMLASPEPNVRTSLNSVHMLPVIVARSSPGGVVIRHVFPVLLMTSLLVPWRHVTATPLQRRTQANTPAVWCWLRPLPDASGCQDWTSLSCKGCRDQSLRCVEMIF